MEPRIATLLGDSTLDRVGFDPLPPITLPSFAPPHPIEPNAVNINDEARKTASKVSGEFSSKKPSLPSSGANSSRRKRQKPSVPIAGVLNHEKADSTTALATHSMSPSSHAPFSGRLSDLLLENPQQRSKKRRRLDEEPQQQQQQQQQQPTNLNPVAVLTGGGGSSENKRKLPKPMQPSYAKKPKGINLPPLLQPILQPPPISGSPLPSIMRDKSSGVRSTSPVLPPLPSLSKIQERDRRDDIGREEANQERTNADGPVSDATVQASSSTTSDKENNRDHRSEPDITPTASASNKTKGIRKRNKWSEQETKDLLVGVSRFGIGNWKKILQCSDFTFNQRSAVDLKDRFRVCCPGDGLKLRKSRRKDGGEEPSIPPSQQDNGLQIPSALSSTSPSTGAAQDPVTQGQDSIPSATSTTTTRPIKQKRPRPESDRKGPADLAQMGIHTPFTLHKRRKRREFTKTDDTNLLVGFEKYGTSWHLMRDDPELGFTGRHATDLRDRFRIRYPEKFASAGCKPKAKDETILKEKRKQEEAAAATKEGGDGKDGKLVETEPAVSGRSRRKSREARPSSPTSSLSRMRPPSPSSLGLIAVYRRALYEPLRHSFPSPIPGFADLASDEGDADEISSPVVLSRSILQWAEANPSSSSQTASSMTNPSSSNDVLLTIPSSSFANSTDTSALPIMNGSDGLHIDPSITFNSVPMPLLTSAMSTPSNSQPQATPLRPTPSKNGSSNAIATLLSQSSTFSSSTNPLLRTPNLPTMMHPPVPVSSAKSAIHNLPPPSDLLSSLDLDGRADTTTTTSQPGSFVLDESSASVFASLPPSAMGVGFDASATLAPMAVRGGATGAGRDAIFQLDRDVLDEAALVR